MASATVLDLESLWPASTDEPHAVFAGEDPPGEAGTYVIEPGERVPETGTTSHDGTEVSVLLEGTLVLGTADEEVVERGSLVVIPEGLDHYSENIGDGPARIVYAIFGDL